MATKRFEIDTKLYRQDDEQDQLQGYRDEDPVISGEDNSELTDPNIQPDLDLGRRPSKSMHMANLSDTKYTSEDAQKFFNQFFTKDPRTEEIQNEQPTGSEGDSEIIQIARHYKYERKVTVSINPVSKRETQDFGTN